MKYIVRWWRYSRSVYPFEGVKMTERVTEDQSRVVEYEVELEAGSLDEARGLVEKEDGFAKIMLVVEKPDVRYLEAHAQSCREISSAKDAVFAAALTVGRHWNDQEGVNGSHLDTLSAATVAYDRAVTSWKLRAGGMYGKDASRGRRSDPVDVVCDGDAGELVARGDGVDEHSGDACLRENDAEDSDGA
jgi:hypothetical protein